MSSFFALIEERFSPSSIKISCVSWNYSTSSTKLLSNHGAKISCISHQLSKAPVWSILCNETQTDLKTFMVKERFSPCLTRISCIFHQLSKAHLLGRGEFFAFLDQNSLHFLPIKQGICLLVGHFSTFSTKISSNHGAIEQLSKKPVW